MVLPGRFRALQGIQGLSRTGGFGRFRCQWVNYYTFQMCKKSLTSKANVVAMHLNDLKLKQSLQMRAPQRGIKNQQLRQKTFEEYDS